MSENEIAEKHWVTDNAVAISPKHNSVIKHGCQIHVLVLKPGTAVVSIDGTRMLLSEATMKGDMLPMNDNLRYYMNIAAASRLRRLKQDILGSE